MNIRLRMAATARFLRRDLLRSMRLIFLVALIAVAVNSLVEIILMGLPPSLMAFGGGLLAALCGLRVVEYVRARPVPLWVDAAELGALLALVLLTANIDIVLVTLFHLVMFRGAVSRLRRLVPMVMGYCAIWITASELVAVPTDSGALGSLAVVGLMVYGMRVLLLRLHEQHRSQRHLLEAVLQRLPFPVLVTDDAGAVVLANGAATDLTGRPATSDEPLSGTDIVTPNGSQLDLRALAAATALTGASSAGLAGEFSREDGSTCHIEVHTTPITEHPGQRPGAIIALLDVTAQRRYEEHLHRTAYHDILTGLPNRALLWQRFEAVAATMVPFAVLIIDLTEFKQINDTLGHQIGDEMLRAVADRVLAAAGNGAGTTVARLGGDEFAILLEGASLARADAVADAVAAAFDEQFTLSCGPISGHGTVGLALGRPGQSADEVMATADAAMYNAKRHSRHLPRAARGDRNTLTVEQR